MIIRQKWKPYKFTLVSLPGSFSLISSFFHADYQLRFHVVNQIILDEETLELEEKWTKHSEWVLYFWEDQKEEERKKKNFSTLLIISDIQLKV